MVKTAIEWNWNRAKVQWKFLHSRERRYIYFRLAWIAFFVALFTWEILTEARPGWYLADLFVIGINIWGAWTTFTDHLSPNLLTQDELTKGTE